MADPNHNLRIGHMRRRLLQVIQHLRDAEALCYAKQPDDALAECDAIRRLMVEFDVEGSSFEHTMALFAFSQANNPTPKERRKAQRDQEAGEAMPVEIVERRELPSPELLLGKVGFMEEITVRPLAPVIPACRDAVVHVDTFLQAFKEAVNA